MLDTIFLIILLLLATLMHSSIVRGFPVNCPAFAEPSAVQKDSDVLEVSVDQNGQVYIDTAPIKLSDIGLRLLSVSEQMQSNKVLVRGDNTASYGRVAQVLGAVSRALPGQEVILVTQTASPDRSNAPTEPNREEPFK